MARPSVCVFYHSLFSVTSSIFVRGERGLGLSARVVRWGPLWVGAGRVFFVRVLWVLFSRTVRFVAQGLSLARDYYKAVALFSSYAEVLGAGLCRGLSGVRRLPPGRLLGMSRLTLR